MIADEFEYSLDDFLLCPDCGGETPLIAREQYERPDASYTVVQVDCSECGASGVLNWEMTHYTNGNPHYAEQ
jgi:uncharacterized protein with PIN domain